MIGVFMVIGNLEEICYEIINNGKDSNTPVAVIQQGTTAAQRTAVGTLQTISSIVKREEIKNPAIIVVGEVVRFRKKLQTWEQLNGQRDWEVETEDFFNVYG